LSIRKHVNAVICDNGEYYATYAPDLLNGMIGKQIRRIRGRLLVLMGGDAQQALSSMHPGLLMEKLILFIDAKYRKFLLSASGVVYVTPLYLQSKYPASTSATTVARSSAILDSELRSSILRQKQSEVRKPMPLRKIIAVGSQENNHKGFDLLLDATANLASKGVDLEVTIVGDGKLHSSLVGMALDLRLENVRFIRAIHGVGGVSLECANHDLLIIPSRTEGMPKVMLEAMWAGVLVLGARVGGIQDVLSPESLFEPKSSESIVLSIERFLNDPDLARRQLAKQQLAIEELAKSFASPKILDGFLSTWISKVHP
jgi:glycosyltransferase involved in cell wall biosynthesis